MEVYEENLLRNQEVLFWGQVMLASSWEQKKKSDCKAIGDSLGCSPYLPISEQRGKMNPIPDTTQDVLLFLLVRFLFVPSSPSLNQWVKLNYCILQSLT